MSASDSPHVKILVHSEMPPHWPSVAAMGEARGHVFQTREFISAWLQTYGAASCVTPLFVEVRDTDDRPLLLIPFAIERRGRLSILKFTDSEQADYNAPLVFARAGEHPELATRGFWDQVFAALPPFDFAMFEKLPEKVGELSNPMHMLATRHRDAATHGNALARPWPEVESAFQSPREMRKKRRQLERVGTVRLVFADDPDIRQILLERLVAQKQRRSLETEIAGYDEDPQRLAFLQRATELFADSKHLLLCGLMVNDEIVAVQWALTLGGHCYALVIGFEGGQWAKFSCGRLLHFSLLQWLHERGFTYFDQGLGDEAYKLQSCDTTIPLGRATIAFTARGKRHLARHNLLNHLKATPVGDYVRQVRRTLSRGFRRRALLAAGALKPAE
jgi:CelD/BcsL family acetyltransferase involved in cellulose biosynthesis